MVIFLDKTQECTCVYDDDAPIYLTIDEELKYERDNDEELLFCPFCGKVIYED